ncbi:hypothetical protein OEB99_14270 [Actinotalea sp. M2MS4P-6]|uniref:hypothetical protein n=1 Tax=Actinotalea sp. M2MS4P-6 TaxID=2983762 RepID=UPI0021E3F826|nr:hypothetical protein [Actinotalea sp. M2MS4P-6]MCV2395479.1 hypothetical protein [Actinotalea sp. M2MS4P-6]
MDEIYPNEPSTTETNGTADAAPAPTAAPVTATGLRVGTLVWGLIVAAVAVGMVAIANGALFDIELAIIVLLAAAGLVLLVGSVVRARKRA